MRSHTAQQVLIESGGGTDVQRFIYVSINRCHEISRILRVEVYPIRGHARQVSAGVLCHRAELDAVSVGSGRGIIRQRIRVVVAGFRIVTALLFDVVTDAIGIEVFGAGSAADTDGIELVSIAVAIGGRNVGTAAIVDFTGAVAHATCVEAAYAIVRVVADAIAVGVRRATSTTHTNGIQLVAITITGSGRNIVATAIANGTRAIANATLIHGTDAVVRIVADAVAVRIPCTRSSADAQGIRLVAIAVAIAGWNLRTSAIINGTRAIANTASIEISYTVVDIVTNPIGIDIRGAISAAVAQCIIVLTGVSTAAGGTSYSYAQGQ